MGVVTQVCWPKRVVSGAGALKGLGEIVKEMGKKRIFLMTGRVMKDHPAVKEAVRQLEADGCTVYHFSEIGPNPVESMVHDAVASMKKMNPDLILCIGGGSPIDAAKAANVVYTHGGVVNDYDVAVGGIAKIMPKLLPLIAVPTTAGTGTEVTFVGVITDTKNKTKFGVLSPLLIPDVAILDPELTVSMSPPLTASTGIDALTHCVEAYTSVGNYPPADALALQGIRMIARSLPTAVRKGQDIASREEMLVASMMAGTAFSLNGLGACHAMAHQLSAFFDTPHGMANAILLPHVMRFNVPACPQKFAEISTTMGVDTRGLSTSQAAEKAVETVEQLCRAVEIPQFLDDVGALKDRIPDMVERAMRDNPLTTNPRKCVPADLARLYAEAFR